MKRYKKIALTIYFQIGVNIIGLPDIISQKVELSVPVNSKYHN